MTQLKHEKILRFQWKTCEDIHTASWKVNPLKMFLSWKEWLVSVATPSKMEIQPISLPHESSSLGTGWSLWCHSPIDVPIFCGGPQDSRAYWVWIENCV